jgi:ketosteroid isomerase-like protein
MRPTVANSILGGSMATTICPVCDCEITDGGIEVAVGGNPITVCGEECAEKVKTAYSIVAKRKTAAEQASKNNLSVIREVYAAFGSGDYARVLGYFDSRLEWFAADNSPLADRSPYRGLDAVKTGVFDRIAAGFERLEVSVAEMFEAGNKVVALGYYDGTYRGSSVTAKAQVAHIWTLANGRPIRFQQYLDTLRVAENAKAAASGGGRN